MTEYICHCTHVDGNTYPDPVHPCPNGHTRPARRALDEAELNTYLAACDGATDEELLDVKAPDGVTLRDILTDANAPATFTASFPAKDMDPEALTLMTGMHPSNFEHPIHAEGRALVAGILARKEASE